MKFPMIYRYSTIVNKLLPVFALAGVFFPAFTVAANCEYGKGITSNSMVMMAGNGDSLCIVSWDQGRGQYSIHATVHDGNSTNLSRDDNWNSYSLGCINADVNDVAFGDGKAILCFDTLKYKQAGPLLLLSVKKKSIDAKRYDMDWSRELWAGTSGIYNATEAVWVNGAFYLACLDGGLVKWDYKNEKQTVFLPGQKSSIPVSEFKGSISKPDSIINPDTMSRVVSVKKNGDNVVVVTPRKIWIFSTVDSSWDSSISSDVSNTGLKITSFTAVYPKPGSDLLYAAINVSKQKDENSKSWVDTTILAKYSRTKKTWQSMVEESISDVVFGPGGYMFVTDNKRIVTYIDTLSDSLVATKIVISSSDFDNWITNNFAIDIPFYSDILYLSLSDSTGYLWVSSYDGIFLTKWKHQVSPPTLIDFLQIKRAPAVEAGLEKTYARPGILTSYDDLAETKTVFIYNLSKDAKVTIRVYDYNMDLVKTIINNKFRRAGKNGGHHGRSTVESEDWWNGRNSSGKLVAPGVYYYKITTDIGERAFGKIVVAK